MASCRFFNLIELVSLRAQNNRVEFARGEKVDAGARIHARYEEKCYAPESVLFVECLPVLPIRQEACRTLTIALLSVLGGGILRYGA